MGSESKRIVAGSELSYLQQIQGGQQIGEETSHQMFEDPTVPRGNQLANRRFTCVEVLRDRRDAYPTLDSLKGSELPAGGVNAWPKR